MIQQDGSYDAIASGSREASHSCLQSSSIFLCVSIKKKDQMDPPPSSCMSFRLLASGLKMSKTDTVAELNESGKNGRKPVLNVEKTGDFPNV